MSFRNGVISSGMLLSSFTPNKCLFQNYERCTYGSLMVLRRRHFSKDKKKESESKSSVAVRTETQLSETAAEESSLRYARRRWANWLTDMRSTLPMPKLKILDEVNFCYESVVNHQIPLAHFFEEFEMADTYVSWFTVVELHMWLLSARLMKCERTTFQVRDMLIDAFWEDAIYRSHMLGIRAVHKRRTQMGIMGYQFQAAMYGYDEGIQTNDMVLAAIVWRRFFGMDCDDATKIERLVKYIRVQLDHLSKMSFDDIILKRENIVIPLDSIRLDE